MISSRLSAERPCAEHRNRPGRIRLYRLSGRPDIDPVDAPM